jgi:hypothetical protein
MNTLLLIVSAVVASACSKAEPPSATTADAAVATLTVPVTSAVSAPGASAMPGAMASAVAAAAAVATAIPSQADESILAAKEIDKGNYKAELTAIDQQLK